MSDVSTAAVDHDSFTPAIGEKFTQAKAEAFTNRYSATIDTALQNALKVIQESPRTAHLDTIFVSEFAGASELLNWAGSRRAFLRGHSDSRILVAWIIYSDTVENTTQDRIANIWVEFDSEDVIVEW